MLIVKSLCVFFLVLEQGNTVLFGTTSMIHVQNGVFLMLLKTLMPKVFNVTSRTNETRHIEWHETCKCKSRLDASFFKNE